MPTPVVHAAHVAAMRRFNRFYTRQIGLLQDGMLDTRLSLTEARVIYELGQVEETTASAVATTLGLDHGYLSRILRGFSEADLIHRRPAPDDRRQTLVGLTATGRDAFQRLDRRSQDLIAELLAKTPEPRQRQLVEAMRAIETILDPDAPAPAVLLRGHRAGDMGFVVESHASVYAAEHGWGAPFEALVADIAATFLHGFDPAHESCWIAEMDGLRVGSVMLVNGGERIAKLRLLLVLPLARGRGLGHRLVAEAVAFARTAGYRRITLWTQSILTPARRIYQDAGFRLIEQRPHCDFGHELVGETWELPLIDEEPIRETTIGGRARP